jgi:hypothetical protein
MPIWPKAEKKIFHHKGTKVIKERRGLIGGSRRRWVEPPVACVVRGHKEAAPKQLQDPMRPS